MKLLIMALSLALSSHALWAQMYCRNDTQELVWISIAYNHVPADAPGMSVVSQDNWIIEGWYSVQPGETVQLSSHIGYDRVLGSKTNFFFYGTSKSRDYSGGRFFLIDNSAPFLPNQLSFRVDKGNRQSLYHPNVPSLQKRPFRPTTEQKDGEYTIVIAGNEINDEPIMHDVEHEESYFK
ncbi:MAG: hypothetical protein IPL33_07595 [Sphingobacteriales bacterium]|nr:hypothetical protein [Sphingobacteriales bacterium]